MVHHAKSKELGLDDRGSMVMTERSLIGAFRGYHSSTGSALSTPKYAKDCRAESPTPGTQLETDLMKSPHPYSLS